jgi:hypothetical protein
MLTFNNLNIKGGISSTAVPARNGSILLNGSADYLTVPASTEFVFGTGDFTVEGWYYFNSLNANPANYEIGLALLGTGGTAVNFAAWYLRYNNNSYGNSVLGFYRYDGAETTNNFSLPAANYFKTNTWYHIACTRQGTNLRMFLNGIQVGTTITSSLNFASINSDPLQVGKVITGNGTYFLNGQATNIRVVKGIAAYTANFTPSISILPATQAANVYGIPSAAIPAANTALLLRTFNEPFYLEDTSPNVKVLSQVGSPVSTDQNPFYINGSIKFNGSTDYLTVPNSTSLQLGAGDFTVECWVYFNSMPTSTSQGFICKWASNSGWELYYSGSSGGTNRFAIYCNAGSGTANNARLNSSTVPGPNVWYHVAMTRASGTISLFVNGLREASVDGDTSNFTETTAVTIGSEGGTGLFMNGYITNARIVKGIAAYTANFTPSISILPATQSTNVYGIPSAAIPAANTSLLLNTGGLPLLDSSTKYNSVTQSGLPSPNSIIHPFYTKGSILLNGTGKLTIPIGGSGASLDLTTSTFTIEAWVYATSNVNQLDIAGATGSAITTNADIDWQFLMTAGGAICFIGYSGTSGLTVTGSSINANTWNHVAVTRIGANATVWVNGVGTTGTVYATTNTNNGILGIGVTGSYNIDYWKGHISNFRIVKDIALYYTTNNYVVPTRTLSSVQNTQLLLNTASPTTYITDTSPNNFTVTNNNGIPYAPPSPVNSGGSLYFPGTGTASGNLSVTSSTIFNLTGDFTIEAWIYPTVILGGENGIIDARVNPGSLGVWFFEIDGAGKLNFFDGSYYAGTNPIAANVWTHVAVVRSGSILTHYINGKIDLVTNIGTGALSPGTTQAFIGATKNNGYGANYGPVSYITNLRLVNGTAVYTAPFSPSTSPLTAVANTVLLLNVASDSSYITDSSPSPVTLIPNSSNVKYVPNGPNVANIAGTLSFNGIDQYLSVGTTSDWAFLHNGTQDYTVEAWIYLTAITPASTATAIISTASYYGNIGILFSTSSMEAGDLSVLILTGGLGPAVFGYTGSVITGNTWNHCAFTFSTVNKVGSIYLNGNLLLSKSQPSITYNSSSTSTYPLAVGRVDAPGTIYGPGQYFPGYITNLRIVKGAAIYNSNFIPSNRPLPVTQAANVYGSRSLEITSSANTSLLLNTAGLTTLDSSIYQNRSNANVGLSWSTFSPF